jgi:hypothetical protein
MLNTEFSQGVLICVLIGLLFFLFAWLIWKKKKLWLIAGYQESEFQGDKNKLARDMGIFCMIIGVIIMISPFAIHYIGEWMIGVLIPLFIVLTIGVIVKVNRE